MRKVPKGGKYSIGQTLAHSSPNSPLLIPPPCRYRYLFTVYDEIAFHGKDYSMGGASPLKWTELESWWRMFGSAYTKDELELIILIDRLLMINEGLQNDDDGRQS